MDNRYVLLTVVLVTLSFAVGLSRGKQNAVTTTIDVGCKTEEAMLQKCLSAVDYYKNQLETGRPEGCPKTAVETVGEYFCGKRAKNIRYDNDSGAAIMITCYDGRILNFSDQGC